MIPTKSELRERILKEIFVKTGGRPENPNIANACADIVDDILKNIGVSIPDTDQEITPGTFEEGQRVMIPAAVIEFNVGSHTIWVQSPQGATILRMKCTGKINVDQCVNSPTSHSDLMINGDIQFCLSADANS